MVCAAADLLAAGPAMGLARSTRGVPDLGCGAC